MLSPLLLLALPAMAVSLQVDFSATFDSYALT